MTIDSRRTFDTFYRKIIYGEDKLHPKPKSFKLAKNQLFPEKGLVFDYFWEKKNNGTWTNWVDAIEKNVSISPTAKVRLLKIISDIFIVICFRLVK